MGWNDRLPEDPNIPYDSAQDRDDYDAWSEYVEACRIEAEAAAGGLTSQTVDPTVPPDQQINIHVDFFPRDRKLSVRAKHALMLARLEKLIKEIKTKN